MSEVEVAAIRARHAAFFEVNWPARLTTAAVIAAMAAIYLGAFVWFDVPWKRIVPGFRQLVWFVGEMIPPDPGGISGPI